MKRILVLALGLLVVPAAASAQLELGLDAGVAVTSFDDVGGFSSDSQTEIDIPTHWARLGFAAGETIMVETLVSVEYGKEGDESAMSLLLLPGINFLLGEQFYVRGEAGLSYVSVDPGTGSLSGTQYIFGGAAGLRVPLGDMAIFRAEAGVARLTEVDSDFFIPSGIVIRGGVGISAIIG